MDYENYWEAPAYLWEQKEVTEREMECVMVRFFFVFAFAFSILPPIHLCTFSSSLYLYCVLVVCSLLWLLSSPFAIIFPSSSSPPSLRLL